MVALNAKRKENDFESQTEDDGGSEYQTENATMSIILNNVALNAKLNMRL